MLLFVELLNHFHREAYAPLSLCPVNPIVGFLREENERPFVRSWSRSYQTDGIHSRWAVQ
jgi:hypothetical protein